MNLVWYCLGALPQGKGGKISGRMQPLLRDPEKERNHSTDRSDYDRIPRNFGRAAAAEGSRERKEMQYRLPRL